MKLFILGLLLPLSLNAAPTTKTPVAAPVTKIAAQPTMTAPTTTLKTSSLAPVRMLTQPDDRIQIRGYHGSVFYTVDETAKDISVQVTHEIATSHADDWQFNFKREGNIIFITIDGPISKSTWSEVLATNTMPNFNLRLSGPSRPMDINWYQGDLTINQLQADLRVTAIKAKITTVGGQGELNIATQEGSVIVRERKGAARIDTYLAKVDNDNVEGQLDVHNFTGDTDIQNAQGDVAISTYKGPTKVAGGKGKLDFKNGNSPLRIEKFQGELRGRSAQGSVYAEVQGEADVRVESAEGPIDLRLPASGAWVNVGTNEGSMAVPGFLKATRLPSQQIRSGRLRGSQGGSVFIRTTSGDIRIR
jgi:DUF4097 and DUF4098 domain-containing protein YvlB